MSNYSAIIMKNIFHNMLRLSTLSELAKNYDNIHDHSGKCITGTAYVVFITGANDVLIPL